MPYGLYYDSHFLSEEHKDAIRSWLKLIRPIWEWRYRLSETPPQGKMQRRLLRPVYWMGGWQFASLGYYHPPKKTKNRCVRAEPFPPWGATLVRRMEAIVRQRIHKSDIPGGWSLNTCLVNLYGRRFSDGKWIDCARVGEHRDYEPGPVASVSLGERALFQFVSGYGQPVLKQWLEDGSLQIFAGPQWKDKWFHRVQRVERKGGFHFEVGVDDFEVRRVNLTFRYVPESDWVDFRNLGDSVRADLLPYIKELGEGSKYFRGLSAINTLL